MDDALFNLFSIMAAMGLASALIGFIAIVRYMFKRPPS